MKALIIDEKCNRAFAIGGNNVDEWFEAVRAVVLNPDYPTIYLEDETALKITVDIPVEKLIKN